MPKLVEIGWAWFHDFRLAYEELQQGVASYSVAIVEWPNGQLEDIPLYLVKFNEPFVDREIQVQVHMGDTPMLFERRNEPV